MKKALFHIITNPKTWLKIAKQGLKASSDGYIYVITTKDVAVDVAQRQLFSYDGYGIIRISPEGITGVIEYDNVAEYTAKYQRRIRQKIIEPKYLRLDGMYGFEEILTRASNNLLRRKERIGGRK